MVAAVSELSLYSRGVTPVADLKNELNVAFELNPESKAIARIV